MASNSKDSSEAVQKLLAGASGMPNLGEPLSEEYDDPLLDSERIELDNND